MNDTIKGGKPMNSLEEIKNQINELKMEIDNLVKFDKNLSGEAILKVSQKLDELINLYNRISRQSS